jgi:hypothetical protein
MVNGSALVSLERVAYTPPYVSSRVLQLVARAALAQHRSLIRTAVATRDSAKAFSLHTCNRQQETRRTDAPMAAIIAG